jgi:hypothetical protein
LRSAAAAAAAAGRIGHVNFTASQRPACPHLQTAHLALPLLVLIAQQLNLAAHSSNIKHDKLVAEMLDKTMGCAIEYVEFLKKVGWLSGCPARKM